MVTSSKKDTFLYKKIFSCSIEALKKIEWFKTWMFKLIPLSALS